MLIGLAALLIYAGLVFISPGGGQSAVWLGLLAIFIATRCWSGLRQALTLSRMAKLPRRQGFACPSCKTAPPIGERWRCAKCGKLFDFFLDQGTCPHCATQYNASQCLDCGTPNPIAAWQSSGQ